MPTPSTGPAKSAAQQVAFAALRGLAPKLEELVLARDIEVPERILAGFSAHLQAIEQLLESDASVSVRYATSGQADVRDAYERSVHALSVLKRLHGPQAHEGRVLA